MQTKIDDFYAENQLLIDRIGFDHLNYHMNISLQDRYLFFETPKAGCSTIKLLLQRAELRHASYPANPKDVHIRIWSPHLQPIQLASLRSVLGSTEFLKFCFVREPYARALSCYLHKIVSEKRDVRLCQVVLDLLGRDGDPEHEPVSFTEFLRAIVQQPARQMDPHWRPQYVLLSPDLVPYDVVGRFERLEDDLRAIAERIGIDFDLYFTPNRPHRTNACDRMREFYGPEERALVRELYAVDFFAFGYDPAALDALEPTGDRTPEPRADPFVEATAS